MAEETKNALDLGRQIGYTYFAVPSGNRVAGYQGMTLSDEEYHHDAVSCLPRQDGQRNHPLLIGVERRIRGLRACPGRCMRDLRRTIVGGPDCGRDQQAPLVHGTVQMTFASSIV